MVSHVTVYKDHTTFVHTNATHTVYLGCPMFHSRVAAATAMRPHNATSTSRTAGVPSPRNETDEESRSFRQKPRPWLPSSLPLDTSSRSLTSLATGTR